MPQSGVNYEGRRRGMRHNICKANGQAPGTGLVNGEVVPSDFPSVTTRTSESKPAGTLNGTKPQCIINGYINHEYKSKSREAPPPRTLREQGSTISAVTDALAAGRVSGAAIPGDISKNEATILDTVALPCNSDQVVPEPSLSTTAKKERRWKKFGHKKRLPLMAPQEEEEDWENEIEEVTLTLTDWQKMCFGVRPYGPEDVLHFALRDLTLKQTDTVDLPVTANYSPAVHHPCPVRWSCNSIPTEPGQFADADE